MTEIKVGDTVKLKIDSDNRVLMFVEGIDPEDSEYLELVWLDKDGNVIQRRIRKIALEVVKI
jgi:hypothetical protein